MANPARRDSLTGAGGDSPSSLELYWIPLGAGARVVRRSGRIYESLAASWQHRPRCDLYHSALVATTSAGRYTIEMTPVPSDFGPERRGVVGEGTVGSRLLGRFRIFRYEIRCWLGGDIPDLAYAAGMPIVITRDERQIDRVVHLVRDVPTLVWGRDELKVGDMWNSNSVVSWTLDRAGLIEEAGELPVGGRAPGWCAGLAAAERGLDRAGVGARRLTVPA